MFWKKIAIGAAATAVVVAAPLMAQGQSQGARPIPAAPAPSNQSPRTLDGYFWQNDQYRRHLQPWYRVTQGFHRGPRDLSALREHLAEAWQHFGMSPGDARVVASAYDYTQDDLAGLPSIRGKNNRQIAQMMQLALVNKQYIAADHLLISYERQRLNLPTERFVQ